ncbi:MAG: thymidine phosphorylase [Candidatus Heimdallarchaeota archaeon]|nr:thymidine phosphorylase [Candidatus Heimdallarchaeota archaeon]
MSFKILSFILKGVPSNYLILHPTTAEENDLTPGSLVTSSDGKEGFRLLTSSSVPQGLAGISPSKLQESDLNEGNSIALISSGLEGVTQIIKKKMRGEKLNPTEIETFISSLDHGLLTNSHIAAFGAAVEIQGMHGEEITSVARSILNHSKRFTPKGTKIVDKHSIGGIAGNRITPLMIPIIAAGGLTIPKVSTRAITSPAGTVDALEVVMPVDLTFEEASEVLDVTGACMVNGATVGLGSTADKFLSAISQVKIDPKEMMIASILAKKKAAGADFVLIDLPTGKGSKLPSKDAARALAYDFSRVGNNLGQRVECVISPGDKPIGAMIGPALEMTEVLQILENKAGDLSLKRKAVTLAGLIFEAVHQADRGHGRKLASELIESGKALTKFKDIVEAQGGDRSVHSESMEQAPYSHIITAEQGDIVYSLDSYNIGSMARAAGAPQDASAGVILHVDRGDNLKTGDPIVEIRSHSERKISEAEAMMRTAPPVLFEKSVLEHITGISE